MSDILDLYGVSVRRDCPAMMPDGVTLMADIYRPLDEHSYPVLLQRTPYDKSFAQTGVYQHPAWYARQGYVVIVQDVRGRYASQGEFDPFRSEAEDGARTIEWAAALPGTTGKVGTYGFSYAGVAQLLAAGRRPPALACAAVGCAGSSASEGWTYRGGALQLAFIVSWALESLAVPDALRRGDVEAARRIVALQRDLPAVYGMEVAELKEADFLPVYIREWLRHGPQDEFWASLSPRTFYDAIETPCLHTGGWYDIFLPGTLENYSALRERLGAGSQQLLIGPWQHVPWSRLNGSVDYGAAGDNRADAAQIRFFDRWLKAGEPDPTAGAVYFLGGANQWESAPAWPPAGLAGDSLYLRSGGRAGSLSGDGRLARSPRADAVPDIFMQDPQNPVPSLGGASCCFADTAPIGAFDQRPVEVRNDVLVFTSDPLEGDLDVIGAVELVLWAASDAPDADWTGKLVDVHPDGAAINICDGIMRASHARRRAGRGAQGAGEPEEFRIAMRSIAHRFRSGHSIRLEVSGSNFPAHDRNSGAAGADGGVRGGISTNVVFHDRTHPSRLDFQVRGNAQD